MKISICLLVTTLMVPVSAKSETNEVPQRIQYLLKNVGKDVPSEKSRVEEIKRFLSAERENIASMMVEMGPEDPLTGSLAAWTSGSSEPRDYLIILTGLLNEIADGNFDARLAEDKHRIISDLVFPDPHVLYGVLRMNHQLPELNEALRRALPKLPDDPYMRSYVRDVISGEAKKTVPATCDRQGYQVPTVFESLYPEGQRPPRSRRDIREVRLHPNEVPQNVSGPPRERPVSISSVPRFAWILAALTLVAALLFWKKSKR